MLAPVGRYFVKYLILAANDVLRQFDDMLAAFGLEPFLQRKKGLDRQIAGTRAIAGDETRHALLMKIEKTAP